MGVSRVAVLKSLVARNPFAVDVIGKELGHRASLELHFGCLVGPWSGLEISVVAGEAGHGSDNVLGEQLQRGVVGLKRFVVFAALHGNAVLGALQLNLQAHEILVALELWIIFDRK